MLADVVKSRIVVDSWVLRKRLRDWNLNKAKTTKPYTCPKTSVSLRNKLWQSM
jgi:hypothetical protein